MEKTLHILNELERKELINRYAIAGGIAVLFYTEPVLTFDLDIVEKWEAFRKRYADE